jgi:branched-chain amino acid transport system permease protein
MTIFVEQLYNAVALAGTYLLIALGVTLLFGLTKIVNFAHGEMVTLGAFASFTLVSAGMPLLWAIGLSAVIVGLSSEFLDLGLFRRTLDRPLNGFIISLGLIVTLEAAYVMIWGSEPRLLNAVVPGQWHIGGVILAKERAVLIAIAAAACGLLFVVIDKTPVGQAARALAEDRMGARLLGVRVGQFISGAFIVGTGLAALAGGLLATLFPFTAFFGATFLLKGFAVAIIGGLGNVRGAVVGALVFAFAETFGNAYVSLDWGPSFGLIAMVAIILLRPRGLFRSTEAHGTAVLNAADILRTVDTSGQSDVTSRPKLLRWITGGRVAVSGMMLAGLIAPLLLPTNRAVVIATFALVNAMAAYSLWLPFHYGGVFSIATGAFIGVGAYTAGVVALNLHVIFWLQLAAGMAVATAVAATVGFISLRATGSYFLILTFALAELLDLVFIHWSSVTGGTLGLVEARPPDAFGAFVDFGDLVSYYYLVLGATIVVVALCWVIRTTNFGMRLKATRDNEQLASSLGVDTFRTKLIVFTFSGMLAGLAGVFYLYTVTGIEPSLFTSAASVQSALLMILGGAGSLEGPLIGSVIWSFLPEVLNLGPNQVQFAAGLILILLITVLPEGIVGAAKRQFAFASNLYLKRQPYQPGRSAR